MRRTLPALLPLVACAALASGCRSCASCDPGDEAEEEEERSAAREHFWRAQIAIVGSGRVRTFVDAFDCSADGGATRGACGPRLLRFKELAPPTMEASPAPGWTFARWESSIRDADGAVAPRPGKMPDGRVYLNGFGYADTGQLETVTAVFVPADASE